MIIIGLTGSIAMGKSEVARLMAAQGLPVFDADKQVHAFYDSQSGADVLKPLVPEAVKNHRVDRTTLSQCVLADPALLERIEQIVHAEIAERRKQFIAHHRAQNARTVVVDVPLLFEKSGDKDVDLTVVVSAPEHLQRQRALARSGMTQEKLDIIMSRQMPDQEKRRRATFVIENADSLETLARNTQNVLDAILK